MFLSVSFHPAPYTVGQYPKDKPIVTETQGYMGYIFPEDEVEISDGPEAHFFRDNSDRETLQLLPPSIKLLNKSTGAGKTIFHITKDEAEKAIAVDGNLKRARLTEIQERNACAWYKRRHPEP